MQPPRWRLGFVTVTKADHIVTVVTKADRIITVTKADRFVIVTKADRNAVDSHLWYCPGWRAPQIIAIANIACPLTVDQTMANSLPYTPPFPYCKSKPSSKRKMFFPGDTLCASINSGQHPSMVIGPSSGSSHLYPPDSCNFNNPAAEICGVGKGMCLSNACSCGGGKGMSVLTDPVSVADFPTTQELQDRVEKECAKQSTPWKGSIILSCIPVDETDPSSFLHPPSPVDVCDYLGGQKKAAITRLNFCTTEYPPPLNMTTAEVTKCAVWKKLKHTIERLLYNCGSPVVSSSGFRDGRLFVCQICNNTNKKKRSNKRTGEDYRQTHLTNDGERGERDNGRALPRRTSTQDATKEVCKFGFSVKWDDKGYFITLKRSGGQPIHSGHPKFDTSDIPFPAGASFSFHIRQKSF